MKIIFLDRDGVINEDLSGYVSRAEDFKFIPGSLEAILKLNVNGYEIAIISNQAGIAKGIYSTEDLKKVNDKMISEIEKAGGKIKTVKYCIHADEDNCSCRKPKMGMFKDACRGLEVNFKKSYFIGDKLTDIEAGRRIGCKVILVLSGKTGRDDYKSWPTKPDYIRENLKEAVDWIIGNNRK